MISFSSYMSRKYFLVLTVLLISGIHDSVQEIHLDDDNSGPLDIPTMIGKWYLLGSSDSNYGSLCMTNTVEQNGEKNFTIQLDSVLKSNVEETNQTSLRIFQTVMECEMDSKNLWIYIFKNVSGEITVPEHSDDVEIQILTIDKEGKDYIILYLIKESAKLVSTFDRIVFIFGREKILPNRFLESIEATYYYHELINPQMELISVRSNECTL